MTRTKELLSSVAALLAVGSASAATSVSDYILPSGALAPVVAQKKEGRWGRVGYRVMIGLERLPNASGKYLDPYQLVVDMTAVAKSMPLGCGRKLSVPWQSLRKSFPPREPFPPEMRAPSEFTRSDNWEAQTVQWRLGECQIFAIFSRPVMTSEVPNSMKGIDRSWFQGDFQEIVVRLKGTDRESEYVFAVPFKEVAPR